MAGEFGFYVERVDAGGHARAGQLATSHGVVPTPLFMPVGTQATVKGLTVDQLRATGTRVVLANTYHLTLRPGEELIQRLGGLHRFMGWDGPILTDSGGFQVYSLAARTRITEQGALFHSHIDGAQVLLTPERAVEIQNALGSDIAMVLDDVVGLPAPRERIAEAAARSSRWAQRCQRHHQHPYQVQFAIVQGGLDDALRRQSAAELVELDFAGYAVGGLSVGEPPEEMMRILDVVCPVLPHDRPRYLMGVGRPRDLLDAIARGIDMFDCVMPTRSGRNALAFTDRGCVKLRNRVHAEDPRPLMDDCPCPACRHPRGYLRHLFMAREMLGPVLVSAHNVTFYQRLIAAARQAILDGRYAEFRSSALERMGDDGAQMGGADDDGQPGG